MRYYTVANFISIIILSVGIYYLFMWVVNYLTFSNTYASIELINSSPLYYLTIFLCVGFTFVVDLFLKGIEFNILTTPPDYLRYLVSNKLSIENNED